MADLFFFSLLLNIDTFSAAFAIGFRQFSLRRLFSFALTSAFAGGSATAFGFAIGEFARGLFVRYEHWFACSLLVIVGAHMCWEAFHHNSDRSDLVAAPRRLSSLRMFFVSTITSLDNFAVGVSLGLADKSIRDYSLSIGATAFLATCIGLRLAKFLPPSFGVRLEILGGVTMMLTGVYTLFQS